MNRLIIVGASGHGKVVADIARLNGYEEIVFLDDNASLHHCLDYPVVGQTDMLKTLDGDLFVAIGNAELRSKIMNAHPDRSFPRLIHPGAVVADSAQLGEGTVVMAGAVINPDAVIGRGCIINTASSVDHDCHLGDFVHVAVGAHLCGTVEVQDYTWIGAGTTVSNNLYITEKCMIGAGSLVIKNITSSGTYYGSPARKMS